MPNKDRVILVLTEKWEVSQKVAHPTDDSKKFYQNELAVERGFSTSAHLTWMDFNIHHPTGEIWELKSIHLQLAGVEKDLRWNAIFGPENGFGIFLDGVQWKVIFQPTAVLLSFIVSFEKINPVEAKVKNFVCYL